MVFQDYYALLGISSNASADDVKLAYRNQAIRWHPDKNPNLDTTPQMQGINEAYLILKDAEARTRYDIEYIRYKAVLEEQTKSVPPFAKTRSEPNEQQTYSKEAPRYDFSDEILERWVTNARRQSISLAEQTIRDFRGMVAAGAKAAAKDAGRAIVWQIGFGVIMLIAISLVKSCN